jgi:hypothetical protein
MCRGQVCEPLDSDCEYGRRSLWGGSPPRDSFLVFPLLRWAHKCDAWNHHPECETCEKQCRKSRGIECGNAEFVGLCNEKAKNAPGKAEMGLESDSSWYSYSEAGFHVKTIITRVGDEPVSAGRRVDRSGLVDRGAGEPGLIDDR